MDEKAAIEEAVRSRLSALRAFVDPKTGPLMVAEQLGLGQYYPFLNSEQVASVEKAGSLLVKNLKTAATFVLTDRECDTIIGSWESFPSVVAHADEIIAPEGFVYFSKPIPDPTGRPPDFPIAAFSWSVTPPEDALRELYHIGARRDEFTLTLVPYTRTNNIGDGIARLVQTPIYPVGYVLWAVGVEGGGALFDDPAKMAGLIDERASYIKVLLAFFALLQSNVLVEEAPVERTKKTSDRLKHARKKMPELNSAIRVVRYRKRTGSGNKISKPSKSGRKVGVRYWRAPFWKWVWYPSLEDNRLRRIEPFVSGPEDAPEVGYERIFRPPAPPRPKPVKNREETSD